MKSAPLVTGSAHTVAIRYNSLRAKRAHPRTNSNKIHAGILSSP